MKNRKGVTLLELILAIALIGIILTIGTNIFMVGNKAQKAFVSEADMQANTRLVSEYINNITRFATKTHTIPRSSFQHSNDGVRDPITSYIGITKEGHVVIDEPGESGQPRKIQYLAKKQAGIDYEIVFNKALDSNGDEMDKVLSFSIVGKRDGRIVNEIVSKVDVLNSINIDYLGTPSDPAVAIAYSMVEPGSQEWIEISPDAYIALVLDCSGSMDWDMDGKSTSINDNKRIKILRDKALAMVDRLAALDFNIYVSIVPFGTDANNPEAFKNLHDEDDLEELQEIIDELDADRGNTNTGDGIRRAYYQLWNKGDELLHSSDPAKKINSLSDITQHMMILVDGGTNRETRTSNSSQNLFMNDGNVPNSNRVKAPLTYTDIVVGTEWQWVWSWYYWDYIWTEVDIVQTVYDNRYVNKIGAEKITPYTFEFEGEEKQTINTFVIGFSNRIADYVSLNDIGNAVNGKEFEHPDNTMKPYILASNADELDFAFEQFEAEVENSLWVITRPQLWP